MDYRTYHHQTADRYDFTNDRIKPEWIDSDKVLWFVNGPAGRKPVLVPDTEDSSERALYEYYVRFMNS